MSQPILMHVCTVDSESLYEVCLNTSERVFIISSPRLNGAYPSDVICYWNIPEPASGSDTGIYLSLTGRDIHQVSGLDCDDRLMIHSEAWEEDLVTCGMSHRLPAMINNDVLQSGVETFFVSNASNEGAGFELLVVYIDPPISKVCSIVTNCACTGYTPSLLLYIRLSLNLHYRGLRYFQEPATTQWTSGPPGRTMLLQP